MVFDMHTDGPDYIRLLLKNKNIRKESTHILIKYL